MDCGVGGSTIGAPGRGGGSESRRALASASAALASSDLAFASAARASASAAAAVAIAVSVRAIRARSFALDALRNSSLATTSDVWALFFFHSSTKSRSLVCRDR